MRGQLRGIQAVITTAISIGFFCAIGVVAVGQIDGSYTTDSTAAASMQLVSADHPLPQQTSRGGGSDECDHDDHGGDHDHDHDHSDHNHSGHDDC